jgi:hypothetical protein
MKALTLVCLLLVGFASGHTAEPGKSPAPGPALPGTGINLARDDGGWINVVVDGSAFVLTFFNEQKVPVMADVHHGLVRYAYAGKPRDRTVLTRSEQGRTLVSPSNVRGPWLFRVHLALYDEGPDDLTETYAFSYSQD